MTCIECNEDRRIMAKGLCPSCYMRGRRKTITRMRPLELLEREADWRPQFEARVTQSDGCWEWTGIRNNKGYGLLWVGGHGYLAHRLSWLLAERHGCWPGVVAHFCDNPGCVNPAHLKGTTQIWNMQDASAKGRMNGNRGIPKPTSGHYVRTYHTPWGDFPSPAKAIAANPKLNITPRTFLRWYMDKDPRARQSQA